MQRYTLYIIYAHETIEIVIFLALFDWETKKMLIFAREIKTQITISYTKKILNTNLY